MGAGAFGAGGGRFGAFDPGRRGAKALAAVAVVVVLVAAFLAWRARPRVDPVADRRRSPPASADVTRAGRHARRLGRRHRGRRGRGRRQGRQARPGPAAGRRPGRRRARGRRRRPARRRHRLLNLARKVVDGELILVGVTPPPGAVGRRRPGRRARRRHRRPVNLNTATLADLDTLPGVGPVLAQRILDPRDAQGGFRSVSDLRKVDGIGDSRYEQLKDLVTV